MNKVCCFGEVLLRYSPEPDGGWTRNANMDVYIGGAELNTATALAAWDIPVRYVTTVPDNSLASDLITAIQERKIDTSSIFYSGHRTGLYYLPSGRDLKNTGVIYDRRHSSFDELKAGMLDWDKIFTGISWFHFSAICPALNQEMAKICREAVEAASEKGITISIDLNYRPKLWQYGMAPLSVMPELVKYCDVVMGNIWAEEIMLGVTIDNTMFSKTDHSAQSAKISKALTEKFPKCKQVANTFRFDKDNHISYFSTLYKGKDFFVSREYNTNAAIDKVGSGDCFMAGLIYGNIMGYAASEVLNFATAAAFSKLFIKGDATTCTAEEIKSRYLHYV